MGFRNNQNALQARADALQRELDVAKARVDEAEDAAEATSKQVEELERERNKLAKKLRKFEGRQSQKGIAITVAMGLVVLSGVAGLLVMSRAGDEAPVAVATVPEPEPPGPLDDGALAQFDLVNFTDLTVRALELTYPGPLEAMPKNEFPKWLPGEFTSDGWSMSVNPSRTRPRYGISMDRRRAAAYESHLKAFQPLLDNAQRYYNEKEYLHDAFNDFQLARRYHVELLAGWETYWLHSPALRQELAPHLERLFSTAETELERRMNAAWKLCSDIVPKLLEGAPIAEQVATCNELGQELVPYLGEGFGPSFPDLLTRFTDSAKRAVESEPVTRGMDLFSMANQYASVATRFRTFQMTRSSQPDSTW